MKKKYSAILIILLLTSILVTGCTIETEVVDVDTKTDQITSDNLSDNTSIPSLTQNLPIYNEDFSLICTYDVDKDTLENWHVTDTKNIGMHVTTKGLPENYEVYIDHVHADISLKSTSPQINGITQDSMDDTFHGYSQDGFYINDNTEYYNIFAIDGYTSQFYELWGHAFGDYGTIQSEYKRLTEKHILDVGTYAEKLSVVYDISIKNPDSDKVYTKSVISEILIPISKNINVKTTTF